MKQFQVQVGRSHTRAIHGIPDICPYCHKQIVPALIYAVDGIGKLQVWMQCVNSRCQRTFTGYYEHNGSSYFFNGQTDVGDVMLKEFSDDIQNLSPDFCNIYNQAYHSEQLKLFEICGAGYRKALEFLVKDYAIKNFPVETKKIKIMPLMPCIKEYIKDIKIQAVAERAVWLGNDETHYERKWNELELNDMKILIEITIRYLETEMLNQKYLTLMNP